MKRSLVALLLALTILGSCGYEQAGTIAEIEDTAQVIEAPSPSSDIKTEEKAPEKKVPSTPTPVTVEKAPIPEVSEAPEPVTTCTLSVTCEALLENMDKLKEEKKPLVPPDGIIFKSQTVEFTDEVGS